MLTLSLSLFPSLSVSLSLSFREWTAAQTAEKQHLTQEEQHADRLYHLKACELDQRAVDLAAADEETRRNITTATKEYNLALVMHTI